MNLKISIRALAGGCWTLVRYVSVRESSKSLSGGAELSSLYRRDGDENCRFCVVEEGFKEHKPETLARSRLVGGLVSLLMILECKISGSSSGLQRDDVSCDEAVSADLLLRTFRAKKMEVEIDSRPDALVSNLLMLQMIRCWDLRQLLVGQQHRKADLTKPSLLEQLNCHASDCPLKDWND
jgi:hypothetical protein